MFQGRDTNADSCYLTKIEANFHRNYFIIIVRFAGVSTLWTYSMEFIS